MPNDPGFVPRQWRADTVAAALKGLTASPKTLPARLFYDDEGCRLFYEITRMPEYYLTRTEIALLATHAPAMVPADLADAELVEFGGSDETKAKYLLDLPGHRFSRYVSIDVAETALAELRGRLAVTHPSLAVVPVVADFMQPLHLPPMTGQRLGFFPGSTIGNLSPEAAIRFLAAAARSLGPNSWFLLGADLRKSPDLLLPAYNDSAGVTAAFNLNLLVRLNREADANFDLRDFRHAALWNDRASRIEMHLFATRDHAVRVGGESIHFREAESIHTENSYKHRPRAIVDIAQAAGWEHRQGWTDDAGLFGIFLFRHA